MRRRRWFTGIFSSGISSTACLPWLSSPAMRLINLHERKEAATEVMRAEKCKGTGAFASVDVFEAGALGWYLKPQSKEVDASGRAKGNCN